MLSMKEAAAAYLETQRLRNLALGTLERYQHCFRDLAAFLADRDHHHASQVEHADLEAWLVRLHRQGISAGTRRERILLAKRLFAWLKERGEILTDPARNIEVPKKDDPLPKTPPDQKTMTRILNSLPINTPYQVREKAVVELMYGAMLRFAETLALNLNDVDLDERTVTVRKGKGAKDRVAPLPAKTIDALAAYLAVRVKLYHGKKPKGDARYAFFIERGGKRMGRKAVRHLFIRLRRDYGLEKFHPHLLRHAGAVGMLRGRADLRYVQEALGHAWLDTTKRYTRLVPDDLKRAYDQAFPVLRV